MRGRTRLAASMARQRPIGFNRGKPVEAGPSSSLGPFCVRPRFPRFTMTAPRGARRPGWRSATPHPSAFGRHLLPQGEKDMRGAAETSAEGRYVLAAAARSALEVAEEGAV